MQLPEVGQKVQWTQRFVEWHRTEFDGAEPDFAVDSPETVLEVHQDFGCDYIKVAEPQGYLRIDHDCPITPQFTIHA